MRIAFSGFFLDSSGYGEMARRYLAALLQTEGLEVSIGGVLVDGGWQVPAQGLVKEFLTRPLQTAAPPDTHLLCVAGMDMPKVYPEHLPRDIPRAGMMCWETDRLHRATIEGLKSVDRIIVPSVHNLMVLSGEGFATKTSVVPIPVEVPTYVDELPLKGMEDIPDDAFVFYSVMTMQERKNPLGLLAAYCNEFSKDDNVVLVLKINGPNPTTALATAEQWLNRTMELMALENPPRVLILSGQWNDQMLWALHYRGDCYISLARGEAYGLPLLDAAAIGNRVIATRYGGHVDFLPIESTTYIDYRMTPVLQRYSHFDCRQRWADPDILHAAFEMRNVYDDGRKAKMVPDMSHLLPFHVGAQLKEVLS